MSKLIVVSLIGIPASGKTSLGHKLLDWSVREEVECGIVLISFDDNMQMNYDEIADGDYKVARIRLMRDIEKLLKVLNVSGTCEKSTLKFKANLKSTNLIILDDTMHYRSMRQQTRALCRRVECEHFQVYLDCPLELAMQRNVMRKNQIPELVIEKLSNIIEKPQNDRTILISETTSDDDLKTQLEDRLTSPENLQVFVKTPQEQSLIHQVDLTTRKLLNGKIKSLTAGQDISTISQHLNRIRKNFINDLRSAKIYAEDLDTAIFIFESCIKSE